MRRRPPGVHPAVRRARPVDADRDDQQQEVRRRHRVDRARAVPRGGLPGPRARRHHRPGRHRHPVRGHRPGRLGRRQPAPRRHPRRLAGQRPGVLRRPAARRAAPHQRPGLLHRRRQGRVLVPHDRAELLPDPDRRPGRRAAQGDRPARVPPGPHPLHRRRPRPPPADHPHLRRRKRVHRVRHRLRGQEVPGRGLRRGHRPGPGGKVERGRRPLPPRRLRHRDAARLLSTVSRRRVQLPAVHDRDDAMRMLRYFTLGRERELGRGRRRRWGSRTRSPRRAAASGSTRALVSNSADISPRPS